MAIGPNRAVTTHGPHKPATVEVRSIPTLRGDYILVKTAAVALNPCDWQTLLDDSADPFEGGILGVDYAGTVVSLGDESKLTRRFEGGDRIAGFALHCNPHAPKDSPDGSFAEYIVAKTGLAIKIPDGMSFEEASTLGVGVTTVGQGLYQGLGLPLPELKEEKEYEEEARTEKNETKEKKPQILIYGGSSATGSLAIQYAVLSGYEVITTCSPHNFPLVRSLGATAVFDYRSPTCAADIQAYTSNTLLHAYDCIAEHDAPEICYAALSTAPPAGQVPKYHTLLPLQTKPRKDVAYKFAVGYSATGDKFRFLNVDDEIPEDYVFATKFWRLTERLLELGQIRPHKQDVREGGLEGVIEGLEELRLGRVSGAKLVYTIPAR